MFPGVGMSARANKRVAWFNGESHAGGRCALPFRDRSWVYGDGCFDMTRTFGHRLFQGEGACRAASYKSLKYLRIDPGFGPDR